MRHDPSAEPLRSDSPPMSAGAVEKSDGFDVSSCFFRLPFALFLRVRIVKRFSEKKISKINKNEEIVGKLYNFRNGQIPLLNHTIKTTRVKLLSENFTFCPFF